MKKQLVFLLLLITGVSGMTLRASAQAANDEQQKIFINKKGGIYDQKGTELGYIDKGNIVKNTQGQVLYFIDDNGNVIGADGKKLGIAKKNGFYYNVKGENMLNPKDIDKEKCAILDPQGHNIGTIHKNYKLHACAAHCFFLEQKKQKGKA